MLAPEMVKTLPSATATPRMLVVSVPRLVFQMTSPVRPLTAKTFCWVVSTYSTPSWTTIVHCWYAEVEPPSRLTCQAPPSFLTFFGVRSRSVEWFWLP